MTNEEYEKLVEWFLDRVEDHLTEAEELRRIAQEINIEREERSQ